MILVFMAQKHNFYSEQRICSPSLILGVTVYFFALAVHRLFIIIDII